MKLGDQEGDIRRISLRSTEIQVGDKSTLIVPNSELVTKTVRNMTMGNNQGRIQIQFAVPPSTDVGNLRQALLDAYTAHTNVLQQPAPTVYRQHCRWPDHHQQLCLRGQPAAGVCNPQRSVLQPAADPGGAEHPAVDPDRHPHHPRE